MPKFLQTNFSNWEKYQIDNNIIWISGPDKKKAFDICEKICRESKPNLQFIGNFLKNINIHFGIIIISEKFVIGIVDSIRTQPIFWFKKNKDLFLSSKALKIAELNNLKVDKDQLLAFQMSGYTSGDKTLWTEVFSTPPGNIFFYDSKNELLSFSKYIRYNPWKVRQFKDFDYYNSTLKKEIKNLLSRIVEKADGKRILVPLSAGLDSRLIASGLRKVKYDNVECFSYGLKNNYEIIAGEKIAQKLDYKWNKIEINRADAIKFYKSISYKNHLKGLNDGSSTPGNQDNYIINYLKKKNLLNSDDVIINGSTGDFISGGHVLNEVDNFIPINFKNNKLDPIVNKYIEKHYLLWGELFNNKNKNKISNLVKSNILKIIDDKSDFFYPYGILETLEYENRQAKYVSNMQKVYDFNNIGWQMPLWDKSYVQFWSNVPPLFKVNQNLYKTALYEMNMGGVWSKEWSFPYKPYKNLISILRNFSKIFFIFNGKDKWSKIDRKYFLYWFDIICAYYAIPYKKIILNSYDPRNSVSWNVLESEKILFGSNWQDK